MSRVRGLPALSIARDTNIISAKALAQHSLYSFRLEAFGSDGKRVYPGAQSLSLDGFDQFALHLLYENNRKLCGAARIVKTIDGQLPLCTHFNGVKPRNGDFELSRFVTRADRDGKKAFLYLLPTIAYSFINVPIVEGGHTIFADVLTGYPRTLNRNTYLEFGFEPTGREAFDHDYALMSELFVLRPERFHVFMAKCFKYQERIGRVRISNHSVQDTIQDALLSHNVMRERIFHAAQSKLRRHA